VSHARTEIIEPRIEEVYKQSHHNFDRTTARSKLHHGKDDSHNDEQRAHGNLAFPGC
jgi:hypothetical protein